MRSGSLALPPPTPPFPFICLARVEGSLSTSLLFGPSHMLNDIHSTTKYQQKLVAFQDDILFPPAGIQVFQQPWRLADWPDWYRLWLYMVERLSVRLPPWPQQIPWRILVPNIHLPAESGASLASLVISSDLEGTSGKYFEGRKDIKSTKDSYDEAKQEDLWQWTVNYLAKGDEEREQFEALK